MQHAQADSLKLGDVQVQRRIARRRRALGLARLGQQAQRDAVAQLARLDLGQVEQCSRIAGAAAPRQARQRLHPGAGQGQGLCIVGQVDVDLHQRAGHRRLHLRLAGQLRLQQAGTAGQHLAHRLVLALGMGRVGLSKNADQEILHRQRPLRLAGGARRLLARPVGLPGRQAQAHQQRQRDGRAGRHHQPVAGHELARAVAQAVRVGQHRRAGQVALQILGEGVGAGVALGRVALQGLAHHGVEVAAQRGAARRWRQLAGAAQIALQDRFFQRRAGVARGGVGALPAEQHTQHHPQRINIRRGAHRRMRHLLGRGVLGCQQGLAQLGQRRLRLALVLQLGDAEIEQAHAALGIDQDVGRLQVAVHHQALVGMLHGGQHLQEQVQSRRHVQAG